MRITILALFFSVLSYSLLSLDIAVDVYNYSDASSEKEYIEVYLRVGGSSVTFLDINDQKQAAVNITLTVEQNGKIVAYDKYTLHSPYVDQESDFLDLKRIALIPGAYLVHIVATDANDKKNTIELKHFTEVKERTSTTSTSDIMILSLAEKSNGDDSSPFTKQGIRMEPASYGFIGDDEATLKCYVETYMVEEGAYVKYAITSGFVPGEGKEVLAKYKKLTTAAVTPLLLYLPIDKLPSGNYHFTLDVYGSDKSLQASTLANFVRRNKDYDEEYWSTYDEEVEQSFIDSISSDDLRYHILALLPVAKEPHLSMVEMIISLDNENAKRQFLLDYWQSQSAKYPSVAHGRYMKVVEVVDDLYDSNVGFGFQTDRGHMFLKYGKPNDVISVDTEPDAPPYEIWYYNHCGVARQTNVRFLFYNPSLSHNDYQLLHSTCIGERKNPAWEVELYRAAPESQIGATIEATEVKDGWNRRAKEYFNDF